MQNILRVIIVFVICIVPSVSSALITADLKTGSKGGQVKELQRFLISENFLTGVVTGNFYTLTRKAVIAYQKSLNIPQTGTVGPKTRAEINKRLSSGSGTSAAPAVDPTAGISASVADLLAKIAALTGTTTVAIPQTYATSTAPFDFDQKWRLPVVNIFCTDRNTGGLSSGSGVIIDPRGIILTNAHVGVEYLFAEWPKPSLRECVIRAGSPATPAYKAALLYIPDGYVTDIVASTATSTEDDVIYGKDDYALLIITGPAYAAFKMPNQFPYLPILTTVPLTNTPVYLNGYASEYTSYEMLQRDLTQLASYATIAAQKPIGAGKTPDAISFKGNIVGQHGSSGGAVITNGGQLAGLITFFDKNPGQTTGDKVLNAITTDYIRRDFQADTGVSLESYLAAADLQATSQKFMSEKGVQYQKMFAKWWRSFGQIVPGYYE